MGWPSHKISPKRHPQIGIEQLSPCPRCGATRFFDASARFARDYRPMRTRRFVTARLQFPGFPEKANPIRAATPHDFRSRLQRDWAQTAFRARARAAPDSTISRSSRCVLCGGKASSALKHEKLSWRPKRSAILRSPPNCWRGVDSSDAPCRNRHGAPFGFQWFRASRRGSPAKSARFATPKSLDDRRS